MCVWVSECVRQIVCLCASVQYVCTFCKSGQGQIQLSIKAFPTQYMQMYVCACII